MSTFQRTPKRIDDTLTSLGGERLTSRASTDAKDRDMFSDFEIWADETFWPKVNEEYGIVDNAVQDDSRLEISISSPRPTILQHEVSEGVVLENKSLVADGVVPMKRHVEIQLPSGTSYAAGDYLAILPHNPKETVMRVMKYYDFASDTHVKISGLLSATLPMDTSTPVATVLSSYVELSQIATKRVSYCSQIQGDT